MAKVIRELAVATSSYADEHGVVKSRFQNIGVIMEDKDGEPFLLIDRHFNPAGVPFKQGSDKIIISCFKPKDKGAA